MLKRLRAAFKRLPEPLPPTCKTCGKSPPACVLADGAAYCADCAHGTPAEREAFEGRVKPPSRRRDDPHR